MTDTQKPGWWPRPEALKRLASESPSLQSNRTVVDPSSYSQRSTFHEKSPSITSYSEVAKDFRADQDFNRKWIEAGCITSEGSRHSPRNLILCFDGTGDQFDGDVSVTCSPSGVPYSACIQNTNVVQFVSLLKKDDIHRQLVFYQVSMSCSQRFRQLTIQNCSQDSEPTPTGGTTECCPGSPRPSIRRSRGIWIRTSWRVIASSWSIVRISIGPHDFRLTKRGADTHGDKISIFGFSRGAYTARALAGMLHTVSNTM